MKLKKWLKEYKQMSYEEYKNCSEEEQDDIKLEHQKFCRNEQSHNSQNWRPMTEEEKENIKQVFEKEKKRYETSLKIGGIDERNNYTALHHRYW